MCAPPSVCTAFCVYRLACGPLNNKTPAAATGRLLCAPPCMCTAFRVYRLARGPLNNKTPAVATGRLLCARPCVCTTFRVYRLACGPLNNKTPAVATGRLLCAPRCVCNALCVHRGKMATSPLPYGGSPPLQSGGQNQKWPTCGKVATSPLPYRGSPLLQSGGQNQKWPTCGQSGYLTHAVSGIPTASERGGKIRSGPLVGKVATSPLPYRGSPPLQSGEQNQKWCRNEGRNCCVTPAVSAIPKKGGGRHGPRSAGAKRPLGAFLKGCP